MPYREFQQCCCSKEMKIAFRRYPGSFEIAVSNGYWAWRIRWDTFPLWRGYFWRCYIRKDPQFKSHRGYKWTVSFPSGIFQWGLY
jgi:hypothetical protein